MQKNKILLTGGHAGTTALATIQELSKSKHKWDIFWIGAERAIEGKDAKTLEFKIFPNLGVACYPLTMGRIQRKWTRYTIPSLFKIPFGFIQAFLLLLKIKPKVVLSYGGYVGFPVVFAAYLLGIPVMLHEQTVAVGLANKISGLFAKKIAIAREESRIFFPPRKTILVGNPLMENIISITPKDKIGNPPCIFVSGGSRGAQIINSAFKDIIKDLAKEFRIIHQTGDLDYKDFVLLSDNLPAEIGRMYEVKNFIDPREIDKIYKQADIIVSRAGANTVAEIIYIGRPAIFIPIPWTRYDEQTKNARLAENIGVARIIKQKDLNPNVLYSEIHEVLKSWKKMSKASNNEISKLDKEASSKVVAELEALVS